MAEIEINGKKFELIKKGYAQALQLHQMGVWLSRYGNELLDVFSERPAEEMNSIQGLSFIGRLIGGISPEAMVELFAILLGCSKEFAEEEFDILVLVEAAITVYKEHPTFRRLIDRFFFTTALAGGLEDSSTKSEEPTDGQTSKS